MLQNLYIVETSVIGPLYIRKAAIEMGLNPVMVVDMKNLQGDTLKEITQYPYIDCDTASESELIRLISSFGLSNAAGIITFQDSKLSLVSDISKKLNLPGLGEQIALLKDKSFVARLLPEYSPKTVKFTSGDANLDQVFSLLEESSYGLAIKPRYLAGGKGYRHITDMSEVNNIHELTDGVPAYLNPEKMIAQEFGKGELVSVEGYIVNKVVVFIGFTGRREIGSTESIFIYPYEHYLQNAQVQSCQDAIIELAKRTAIVNSFFHIEFIVTDDKCLLIDCNIGRPAGANIVEVICASYGLDPAEFYRHSIEVSLFGRERINRKYWSDNPRRNALGLAYGLQESAIMYDVNLPKSLKSIHTLAVNRGRKSAKMGDSNWSWVGLLSGLENDVISDIKAISLTTENGTKLPCFASLGGVSNSESATLTEWRG